MPCVTLLVRGDSRESMLKRRGLAALHGDCLLYALHRAQLKNLSKGGSGSLEKTFRAGGVCAPRWPSALDPLALRAKGVLVHVFCSRRM